MRVALVIALILTLLLFLVSPFDRSVHGTTAQYVQVRVEGKEKTIFNDQVLIGDNCSVITEDEEIAEIADPMAICALQNASLQGGFNLNFQDTSLGLFLEGVAEVKGDWRYWVNKQYAPVSLDSYPLRTGDSLVLNVDNPNFPEEKTEIKKLNTIEEFKVKKESPEPRSKPRSEEVSQTQTPKTKAESSKPQIDNPPSLLAQTPSKPPPPIPTPAPTISPQVPTPEPQKQTEPSPIPAGSPIVESKPKSETKTEPNPKTEELSPTPVQSAKPENSKPQIDLPKKEERKESNIRVSSEINYPAPKEQGILSGEFVTAASSSQQTARYSHAKIESPSLKREAPKDLPRTGQEGFPLGVGLSFLFGGILLKPSFLNKNHLSRLLKPARKTKTWYYY